MTVFEKARELGMVIAGTEQALAREKAQEEFARDAAAVEIMRRYEEYQHGIEADMHNGTMTQEQFAEATKELKRLGTEVKEHPVAGAYVEAVNNFNKLLNQVFNILQSIAWGQIDGCCEDGCDCGHGGHGGCGHGDEHEHDCSCGCEHTHM